jgi:hypothetical protein
VYRDIGELDAIVHKSVTWASPERSILMTKSFHSSGESGEFCGLKKPIYRQPDSRREDFPKPRRRAIDFADNARKFAATVQGWRTQDLAWLFCGSSACPVFFQPWSNPQSEIGIGVAEAH